MSLNQWIFDGQFVLVKMACIMSHIKCYIFYVEGAPLGGHFRPPKVSFSVIFAISGVFFLWGIFFKTFIFSKSSRGPILSFWNLDLHIIIYTKQKTSVKHFLGLTSRSWYMWFKQRELKKKNEKLFLFLFWSCVTFGFTARHTRGCFSTWKIWHRRFFSIIQEWKNGAKLMIFINRMTRSESLASITRWTSFSRMLVLWFYGWL